MSYNNGYPFTPPPWWYAPPKDKDSIRELKEHWEFLEGLQTKFGKKEEPKKDIVKSKFSTVQWVIFFTAVAPFAVLIYDYMLIMMLKGFINTVQTLVQH